MANPPITIGPFSTVPAPGSAIQSAWAQEISTVVTGILARQPRFKGVTGVGASSAANFADIQVISWSAAELPVAGSILFWSSCQCNFAGGSAYTVGIRNAAGSGTYIVKRGINGPELNEAVYVRLNGVIGVAGGVGAELHLRGDGTANITTFGDQTVNRLETLYVPGLYAPT